MANKKTGLTLLTIITLCSCTAHTNNPPDNDPGIPVVTAPVEKINRSRDISLSGNIEGFKTVRLGFMVAGKIDFIAANEGDKVKKGELLSSLDAVSYSIAKELADIQVNQVQDEFDRLKLMHDKNSLTESDFVKISSALQLARAQQKLQAKNLSDTKLFSPFDGVLLRKLCETGEITGTGLPLFVVSDIRKIKVSAFIPENELHNISIGQQTRVIVSALNDTVSGKIIEVGSAADVAARAFSVKIEVENPGMLIRPGMIAEVLVSSLRKEQVIAIPVEALLHDFNNQSYVFIADKAQGKAFRRNVSCGKMLNDRIEITSGLNVNDIIVTGGQQNLVDGSSVIFNK